MKKFINKCNDISIVLDNLRSAYNVGNIFRIADAVGVKEIITCGYTASPPHPKLSKTAMGAENYVKVRKIYDTFEAVQLLKQQQTRLIAVETGKNAKLLWEEKYQGPIALIFGNEALGINKAVLQECDSIISLPMLGRKESINVGNCAAVVLFHILAYKNKINGPL